MDTRTNQELLRDYAETRSELAFAELVRRHVNLVYSVALRMVADSHHAKDISQGVFVALSQNARRLSGHPVLSGWLHRTAQHLAANTIRAGVRRQARERKAVAMHELLSPTPDTSWDEIAPHLDAALADLNEPDRDAIMLRYFERKTAAEMAGILDVSDDAAQKRVTRAVERLRGCLAKRGVTVGAHGLVGTIAANAVQTAPAGLAMTISSATALTGATLAATATKAITMTTLQKTLIGTTLAVVAGTGIYQTREASHLRRQVETLRQTQAPLAEQIEQLRRERDDATNTLAALRAVNQRLNQDQEELLRLRGMAAAARRATSEAEQLRAQLAQANVEANSNPVTGAMTDAMTQTLLLQVDGRLSRMTAALDLTAEQTEAARDILTRQAQATSAGMQQAFSGKFDKKAIERLSREAGNPDEQIKALLTPDQQVAYPEYQEEEAAYNASLVANSELLQMQTTLGLTAEQTDPIYAALFDYTFDQLTGREQQSTALPGSFANQGEAMQRAFERKARVLEPLLTETQRENYRRQLDLQAKLATDILAKMEGSTNTTPPPR